MLKPIFSLVSFVLLLVGCNKENSIAGQWELKIKLQGRELPVLLKIDEGKEKEKGIISGHLINSSETIPISGTFNDGKFSLDIGTSYSQFRGELINDKMNGYWVRTNRKDYQLPINGLRTTKSNLFKKAEKKSSLVNFGGNWKIKLSDSSFGLGHFKQIGSRVQGSILTETGDYRYLDGKIEGDKLKLVGFDGTMSFIFEMIIKPNVFSGNMYAGKSHHKIITGVKDDKFQLTDASSLTKLNSHNPLKLKLNNLKGEQFSLEHNSVKGKAKVIQIFGSWCPNCIDELSFFTKWREENQAKLNEVAFIAVAFENFPDLKTALKKLNKLKAKKKVTYPILVGDFKSTKSVTKIFPIEKTIAFPTTLFLNRKNEVVKVHTGFSGQATGEFFLRYKNEFNAIIENLIK